MAKRIETSEFYSKLVAHDRELVKMITLLVTRVACLGEHHGIVAAVGGQLNKRGVRKDIDLKVCAKRETNTLVFREQIEAGVRRIGEDCLVESVLIGNAEIPSLMVKRCAVTPVHLILPSHSHDIPYPGSLKGWPVFDRERYAILAEF